MVIAPQYRRRVPRATPCSYQRATVPGAGGSGQATCPAFGGAADCLVGGASGQGDDCDAEDRVDAGGLDGLAGGAATTFGLGFGFDLGWSGAACASWATSVGGGA
jgi:hypothetical protein